jgi:predicted Rossmann-fold nucleotide-binding protein
VLEAGGEVYGVIPQALVDLEVAHTGCTELHTVTSITFDELFEAWTWNALGYHAKPFALLNVAGFWDGLIGFLDQATMSGFMSQARRDQLLVGTDIGEVIDRLDDAIAAARPGMVW